MELENLIAKKNVRNLFVVIMLMLIISSYGIAVIFCKNSVLSGFAINLSSSVFTSLILAVAFYHLTPEKFQSRIIVLPCKQINEALKENAQESNAYYFKGAMGRWIRKGGVQLVINHCNSNKISGELVIVLLDPRNLDSCERYAKEKKRVNGTSEIWNVDLVRCHIIATVYTILEQVNLSQSVNIKLGFISIFGNFRFDFTTQGGILTQADSSKDGIYIPHYSNLFDQFKQEVISTYNQSYHPQFTINFDTSDSMIRNICQSFSITYTEEINLNVKKILASYKSEYEV